VVLVPNDTGDPYVRIVSTGVFDNTPKAMWQFGTVNACNYLLKSGYTDLGVAVSVPSGNVRGSFTPVGTYSDPATWTWKGITTFDEAPSGTLFFLP
jgi:hypothetical protein